MRNCAKQVINDRDAIIITRKDGENVALIAADELASLIETVYLLRSPKNADRLLSALKDAQARIVKPQTVRELRQELGLGEEA